MTVCVAAMSGSIIFGASDRMITSADIQFEPQQTKLFPFSNSIVAQIAGDASIQTEIIQMVALDVRKRMDTNPKEWWNVRDVAHLYRHYHEELRLTHAEHNILAPLGLNRDTWLTKQGGMDSGLVKNIANELLNYNFPATAVIFSGVDTSGAHIYVARDGNISCQDTVGFASIGAGEWHASSQMMFAGHSRKKSVSETLFLVYSAKRRAEVAPGVGKGTDMFAIGPGLGSNILITDDEILNLENIYKKEQECQSKATGDAKLEVDQYVQQLAQRAVPETQAENTTDARAVAPPNTK